MRLDYFQIGFVKLIEIVKFNFCTIDDWRVYNLDQAKISQVCHVSIYRPVSIYFSLLPSAKVAILFSTVYINKNIFLYKYPKVLASEVNEKCRKSQGKCPRLYLGHQFTCDYKNF